MTELERLQRIQALAAAIVKLAYKFNEPLIFELAEVVQYLASKSEYWLQDNLISLNKTQRRAGKILAEPDVALVNKLRLK